MIIIRKRQYQYKIPANLLRNSKFQEITYSYKKIKSKIPVDDINVSALIVIRISF